MHFLQSSSLLMDTSFEWQHMQIVRAWFTQQPCKIITSIYIPLCSWRTFGHLLLGSDWRFMNWFVSCREVSILSHYVARLLGQRENFSWLTQQARSIISKYITRPEKWQGRVSNTEILQRANARIIASMLMEAQLRWYGNVARMQDNRLAKRVPLES